MALKPCSECGAQVSTEAAACPACGAKAARRTPRLAWLLGGVMAAGVVAAIMVPKRAEQIEASKPTEQRAVELAAKKAEFARYAVAKSVAQAIKEAAREPASVKFDSVRVSEDAKTVCVEYRGRNGFGGVSVEHMVVLDGKTDKSATGWNKRCVQPLADYADRIS